MKSIILLCVITGSLLAASDDGKLLVHNWSTSSDTRFSIGLAAPLSRIEVKGIQRTALLVHDESLSLDPDYGLHVGMEQVQTAMSYSRLGYQWAFGFASDSHRGEAEDGRGITLDALSVTGRFGLALRWDELGDESNGLLQVEISPMAGIGTGIVSVEGSGNSDYGLYLSYGLLVQGVYQPVDHWQIIASLGYQGGFSSNDWSQADSGEEQISGITIRTGCGWRW